MVDVPSPGRLPFSRRRHHHAGIRLIVTGQVGLDKGPFLEQVVEIARRNGHEVKLFNVGALMCAEAPDVVPQRILDLPKQRLTALRRSVFKDILAEAARGTNIIVNTHATFRWKHGLFHAYDLHLAARGYVVEEPGGRNRLEFELKFDQTQLPRLIAELDAIVAYRPVIGSP